ncbi:hypothetical protein EPD60_08360 [Flaviaesturariibacter flavus]|uniref:Periplasmic heavy metal sensor n=1 Tax=Flaviaesturariibacter flavus TaxID=2502780 RepID=A0A4R1BAS1_9BACT|nr:hypothetical protein [Flaviaesturariibacter flavus]TCJ14018.1 hypothetical protein EPD60_08360 [Flaviaesturariibacter flavus]
MKKLLILTLIAGTFTATAANAQSSQTAMAEPAKESAKPQSTAAAQNPNTDKAAMLEKMKEQFKPGMMAKTGLTAAQVDRVLEINLEMRMTAARELRDLNEADRSARIAELKAEKQKKFSEIPLTADQIKSVDDFYAEFARNNPPKGH